MLSCAVYVGYYLGEKKGRSEAFFSHITNAQTGVDAMVTSENVTETVDFKDFWHVWQVLDQNFAQTHATHTPLTNQERVLFAIQGLTKSYDDPFTEFIPKKAADAFKTSVNGEFGGIGAVLNKIGTELYVLDVIAGSPAEISGLTNGDKIIAIDGLPVDNEPLDTAVARIRGEVDTTLALTVRRNDSTELLSLKRDFITLPTTASAIITHVEAVPQTIQKNVERLSEEFTDSFLQTLPATVLESVAPTPAPVQKNYYIIGVASFSKTTPQAFEKELQQFNASGARALIIDLRNNPGGYFDVALALASYFLPEGEVVVRERVGGKVQEEVYTSQGLGAKFAALATVPIYILVNENTASASEIFAGALQEHDRATVVGKRSFGKGSVQQMVDIGTLGTLKVTTARWFTPSGRSLTGSGIEPDIVVDVNAPEWKYSDDPFLDAVRNDLN